MKTHEPKAWDMYRDRAGDVYLLAKTDPLKVLGTDGELFELEPGWEGRDTYIGNVLALPKLVDAAESAADWLCDSDAGSDPEERGRNLRTALAAARPNAQADHAAAVERMEDKQL